MSLFPPGGPALRNPMPTRSPHRPTGALTTVAGDAGSVVSARSRACSSVIVGDGVRGVAAGTPVVPAPVLYWMPLGSCLDSTKQDASSCLCQIAWGSVS